MGENRMFEEIYSRLKTFSGKLYPVMHRSVQEGVAKGFQAAKEKAAEKKRSADAADTEKRK